MVFLEMFVPRGTSILGSTWNNVNQFASDKAAKEMVKVALAL
jgi:hypothetical protein